MTPLSQKGKTAVGTFAQVCSAVAQEMKGLQSQSAINDSKTLPRKCSLVMEESDF